MRKKLMAVLIVLGAASLQLAGARPASALTCSHDLDLPCRIIAFGICGVTAKSEPCFG